VSDHDGSVAIVGMAGRFPGAPDPQVLWERVVRGDDCLVDLASAPGSAVVAADDDHLVHRAGIVDHVEDFDHAFFGLGHRDASIMDPQHRVLHECAWEALESAAIVPERFDGSIGVFAGCGVDTYLINNLLTDQRLVDELGWFLLRHTGNDKDFLATGISYRLDLRGPSVSVQTACSTSLVAMHLAVQSLLGFECDLALAGGATIEVPHGAPYRYRLGEILSPDGRCRAFDAASNGTVLTGGAGMVALRRLDDALASGDPVLAVIRGSAVNNDGSRKVSYLAPSVDGHADAVREALSVAGLSARDIQLLETHGTGTPVGDPIEVAALTEAFRTSTSERGFCRITSTKPNIGHLDTAAGVASVIKVVQALRHRTLPPMANFTAPSPLLDLDRSPFLLSGSPAAWPDHAPRRAGVSSLGVGGTNAHVVLEEAPAIERAPAAAGSDSAADGAPPWRLVPVTGLDPAATAANATAIADHVVALDGAADATEFTDVVHTLRAGRRAFPRRRIAVARDLASLGATLRTVDGVGCAEESAGDRPAEVVALFPGGGSQYVGMGVGLDARFEMFHDVLAHGRRLVRELSGIDLAPFVDGSSPGIELPTVALPAVFLTSLAMAEQWRAWGVHPRGYVGHSLGEYVAAHLCGVIGFEDVVRLVVARAGLMERASGDAAMLVVPLPAESLAWIPSDVSLAAVNAHDECTLAGPAGAIAEVAARLERDETPGTLLPLNAAAHSSLLDPVLAEFGDVVRQVALRPPTGRYTSNLSGTWAGAEVTDPDYWVRHLRGTVRFAECLTTALAADVPGVRTVTVEFGPGHSLSSYARRAVTPPASAIGSMRHPRQSTDDTRPALVAFGRAWAAGVAIDLAASDPTTTTEPQPRRVILPTYRFQRVRCWIDPTSGALTDGAAADAAALVGVAVGTSPDAAAPFGAGRIDDVDRMWFDAPWQLAEPDSSTVIATGRVVLVGAPDDELVAALAATLRGSGRAVTIVGTIVGVEPGSLVEADRDEVVIVAPASDDPERGSLADWSLAASTWTDLLGRVASALGGAVTTGHRLTCVTRGGTTDPSGRWRARRPVQALASGVMLVAPLEYPDLATTLVDLTDDGSPVDAVARAVVEGLATAPTPGRRSLVAVHDGRRFVRSRPCPSAVEPAVPVDGEGFGSGWRVLVTGGLGNVGSSLARHLARHRDADLVLVVNTPLPPEHERERWLADHGPNESTSLRLRRLQRIQELLAPGRTVEIVDADLRDSVAVEALVRSVAGRGRLDAIVHAAGTLHDQLLAAIDPQTVASVLEPKALAGLTLTRTAIELGVPLVVHVSSTSAVLAPAGQSAYVAANAVLDALAGTEASTRIVSIGYGVWRGDGMAAAADRRSRLGIGAGRPVVHPVFEEVVERGEVIDVIGHLAVDRHTMVDHHRLADGRAVLPGTGHVKLMLQALRTAGRGDGPATLIDLALEQPVFVPDPVDGDVAMPVRVRTTADTVELAVADPTGAGWVDASRARWSSALDSPIVLSSAAALAADSSTARDLDPFDGQRTHLVLGDTWKCRARGVLGADVALVHVDTDRPPLHESSLADPPLVDIATGVAVQTVRSSIGSDRLVVPAGYRRVVLHRQVSAPMTVLVERRAVSGGRQANRIEVDVAIDDPDGNRLLDIVGLSLAPIVPNLQTFDAAMVAAAPSRSLAELSSSVGLDPEDGFALADRLVAGALAGGPTWRLGSSVDPRSLVGADVASAASAGATSAGATSAGATSAGATSASATVAGSDAGSEIIDVLATIWKQLLGVAVVAPGDDFFELGGHSLIAIRLMSRIQRELGVKLQLADIFGAQRLDQLTELVGARIGPRAAVPAPETTVSAGEGEGESAWESLVCVSDRGDRRPLFVVHGAGGNVLFLWTLGRALAPDRPVYGFQAIGIDGRHPPDGSIDAMADRYVEELVAAHPGPYLLAGYSGGGTVALEMTRRLQARGAEVLHVVLIDSEPPGLAARTASSRIRNLLTNTLRTRGRSVKPFVGKLAAHIRLKVAGISEQQRTALVAQGVAVDERGLDEYRNLFDHFSAVHDLHPLVRYDVDTTLLKAEREWSIRPYDYAWGSYVRRPMRIQVVGGDHMSMFQPQVVERLGAAIRDVLDVADH
jgi:acyl transferase domain-containing protein/thioesterase domain-containing protein/acyl carrier protein